jgi:hypothetical protein
MKKSRKAIKVKPPAAWHPLLANNVLVVGTAAGGKGGRALMEEEFKGV